MVRAISFQLIASVCNVTTPTSVQYRIEGELDGFNYSNVLSLIKKMYRRQRRFGANTDLPHGDQTTLQ